MANKYFTQLTQLAAADVADGDALAIEDITAGETKYVTASDFASYALAALGNDGWVEDTNTWTYASASTFTIAGDYTAIFRPGVKIKFTQTTVKYAIVEKSSYGAPNTTVTIIVSSDYTLANAAISATYWSITQNPGGWPSVFNWVPTQDGFSSDPAGGIYQYYATGDILNLFLRQPNNGTSDATNLTLSLPCAARTLTNMLWGGYGAVVDSGTTQTTPGRLEIASAGTVVTVYKDGASGAFTNSGNKRIALGSISYRFGA